ncbi:hypothetical protein NECAME_02820 [Necator americanus]|uniref:Uncharacterized protein n=1 Tax=Necator americanus TaxID=51031 RepID=W2T9Y2_NECAM|nr:hypothetical protein NECAME_02820 [Necator americanus]ETN78673.1 hypothetical protein NECAME_02820 [Necator americanus]
MSYITLLYLFFLTSSSDDVIPQASNPLSIWQCHARNNQCGFNVPDGPAIRIESSLITADDLPSENVLVSVDKLVSKILIPEEGSVYGLVILEAGDSSYVEWELSSSSSLSSSFPIVFSYESYPPIVEESFVRGLPIYHFSAAAYQGTPPEVIVVGPGAFLSVVHKSLNASNTPCYNAALIVAPLKWTADVAQAFTQQFSRVVVRECTDCTRLPLSSDFIRLCPISRSEAECVVS